MAYEILEQKIKSLPEEAVLEIAHYVDYISDIYSKKKSEKNIKDKINSFLKNNPNAFDEFSKENEAAIESIRELTKNDTW